MSTNKVASKSKNSLIAPSSVPRGRPETQLNKKEDKGKRGSKIADVETT